MSDFRKLTVYNRALDFIQAIYKIIDKFPKDEQYALANQLKRAATSICANIAEGSGRYHKKDFSQFIRIALGSVFECSSLIDVAFRLTFISKSEYNKLIDQCDEIGKMLNGLIESLTKN
jgi:four helix bundle protein